MPAGVKIEKGNHRDVGRETIKGTSGTKKICCQEKSWFPDSGGGIPLDEAMSSPPEDGISEAL
jgi:hypothetical protein